MALLGALFAITSLHSVSGLSAIASEKPVQWFRASDSTGFRSLGFYTDTTKRPKPIWGGFAGSGLPSVQYNSGLSGSGNSETWTQGDLATSGQAALGGAARTITLLVKIPATVTGFSTLAYKGAGLWLCSGVYSQNTANCYFTIFNGGATSTVRSNDGAWHLVTVTSSGGTHRMYVDNAAAVVSSSSAWGASDAGEILGLGASNTGGYCGEIEFGGFWSWSSEKTAGEVATIHANITDSWLNGTGRQIVLCIGDSNTIAPSPWPGAMAASLATLTSVPHTALVVAESGTKVGVWVPGTARYNSAVDAANSEGATRAVISLATNDCEPGNETPAATVASQMLSIARGFLRDIPTCRAVVVNLPISTWGGGTAHMALVRAALVALPDDSQILLGDTATYSDANALHPSDAIKTAYGESTAAAIYAKTSTGVTKGQILAGATGTSSATLLSASPAIGLGKVSETIAAYGAQYRIGGGGAWVNATWAGSTADPAEGIVSALPAGATHLRRKATGSLGGIVYSDPVAIALESSGAGGGGGGLTVEQAGFLTDIRTRVLLSLPAVAPAAVNGLGVVEGQGGLKLSDTALAAVASALLNAEGIPVTVAAGSSALAVNLTGLPGAISGGGFLLLTSGALKGQARPIVSLVGAVATVAPAFPAVPATNASALIIGWND